MEQAARQYISGAYGQLGVALLIAGGSLTLVAFLVLNSTPLTALGTSAVILSLVCFGLERATPHPYSALTRLSLQTAQENTAALVEELGARAKAIYLPSSMTNDKPLALIPLGDPPDWSRLRRLPPRRLLVHYGPNPHDTGLLISTLGSDLKNLLADVQELGPDTIEESLQHVLIGKLNAVQSLSFSLDEEGDNVRVKLQGVEFLLSEYYYEKAVGSPLASIIASLTAEALNRPVIIASEQHHNADLTIELTIAA